jgi:hypothetical protein
MHKAIKAGDLVRLRGMERWQGAWEVLRCSIEEDCAEVKIRGYMHTVRASMLEVTHTAEETAAWAKEFEREVFARFGPL